MSSQPDEDDLVLIVWSNGHTDQGRPFETMTKHGSRHPVAWRLSYLKTKYAAVYPNTHLVFSEADLESWISPPLNATITRERPLLVPVKYAKSVLGWNDYTVWEGDHELDD